LQAAWELDFWGRFRRGIESADASLQARPPITTAFLVALAADVAAANYVELRSLQEQLAFTRSERQRTAGHAAAAPRCALRAGACPNWTWPRRARR
jgi:outer membrane protein TolC